jgi:riboflavin biosynthesis pyrimidine reductase
MTGDVSRVALPSRSSPRGAEPLAVLLDEGPTTHDMRSGLPTGLRAAYDGDLGIPLRSDRPTVIANFVETLDGAVALDPHGHTDGGTVSGYSPTDRFVMGLLRAMADVVLVGAGTVRASKGTGWTPGRVYPPAAEGYRELRHRSGLTVEPVTLIATARGDLDPGHPAFRDSGPAIVIAAPAEAARRLRGLGFRDGIRIESVGDGDKVPAASLVDIAGELGARVLLAEGGPQVLAGLAGAGLLDELFLTLAPQLVGRDADAPRPSLLEGVALWPDRPLWGRLTTIRRGGDHLFLRYRFPEGIR